MKSAELFVIALMLFSRGEALAGQAADFQAETALVRLDVQVENGGSLVKGLRKEDFRVFDEGQEQPILHFASVSAPVDIVLLLDVSSSMDPLVVALAKTAHSALTALQPGDRVSLLSFTTKAKLLVPFTTQHRDIVAPLQRIARGSVGGNTDLYHALEDACRYIQRSREAEHRRVILMLTDGVAGKPDHELRTLQALWEADAAVDAVIVGPSEHELVRVEIARQRNLKLQDIGLIASQTGGVALRSADVAIDIRRALERSRTRYSLFYRRPDNGKTGFRQVRADLAPEASSKYPDAKVRTRKGYYRD